MVGAGPEEVDGNGPEENGSLKDKTRRNLIWTALDQFTFQGFGFCLAILLARLIEPEEFGLLAIVLILVSLMQIFVNVGLSSSLIQMKELQRDDVSTAFFVNIVIATVIYALLFFAAPYISEFYAEPRLNNLVKVGSLTLVAASFGKCHQAVLTRNLQFQRLFFLKLVPFIISAVIGISMAVLDFRVWALVASQLSQAVLFAFLLFVYCERDVRPECRFSQSAFQRMFAFSFSMFGATLYYQLSQSLYGLVIGKAFPFEELAFYNRAKSFPNRTSTGVAAVFNRVLFPTFAGIQDDDLRLLSALRRSTAFVCVIVMPMMVFLAVAAENIVIVLLTEKWLPSVPLMRWTVIPGMLMPLAAVLMAAIGAKGLGGLFLKAGLIKNSLTIVALVCTFPLGLLPMVIGQACVAIFNHFVVNAIAIRVAVGYPVLDQMSDVIPYFLSSSIAGLFVVLANQVFSPNPLFGLLSNVVIFFSIYVLICSCFRFLGIKLLQSEIKQVFFKFSNRAEMASEG